MTPRAGFGSISVMDDEPWSAPLLLDRINEVLERKKWKPADWAKEAGLPTSKRTHLSNLMARLEQNPRATVEVPLIARLALGANVSLDYLILGRGEPFSKDLTVEADPLYPSRATAITAARFCGYEPHAVEKVRAITDLPKDPGVQYWITLLSAENGVDRRSVPPVPPGGDRSKKRIAARKDG